MDLSVTDFLALDAVTVQFGALRAVDEVSLRVRKGERRAIIGPNGAGKTTLFNAITGVVRATTGKVLFEGADVTRTAIHERARRGMSRTFQITNLFPNLTVAENMRLALRGLSPRKFSLLGSPALNSEEAGRADRALEVSRLGARRDSRVKEMSYGEQRQLEMAMALAAQPRLLLLDEPAAGLSPSERVIVSDIIRALPRDLTLVLIEHDMDLVLSLVDYVTVLNNGKLLVEAPPAEIRLNKDVQDVYLGKARHHA
ncbi:ABC transporter ATP-binding protein [Aquabacter spiritensis]|uniref:Amino acid/amide ABC transporter ATP-binding protein 1 (HAAT family) n=1 Tax=Aquabacter spiritensis TaxID=933073 RepID=A0A4R3LRC2_9HYPH|nr:ABC transporter ATP-binding protein [Aquabacter spiritensis]TCT01075.1 amino acid/amide ABC transporter ATP-binding protein 1 (HAAT family) [Aquabacter spiritensis]